MRHLSCDQCRERWDELIDKSTFGANPQLADVRVHLESCAECHRAFDLLMVAKQEFLKLPTQKAPASLRMNILREIEKDRKHGISWWQSVIIFPQRLAWASGAIATVFLVALLMRPERQTPLLQHATDMPSNRSQVAEQNNTTKEIAPSPPNTESSPVEKKAKRETDPATRGVISTKPKRKRMLRSSPMTSEQRAQQKQTTPESVPEKTKVLPQPYASLPAVAPSQDPASPTPELAEGLTQQADNYAPSPPPKKDSTSVNETAEAIKSTDTNSAPARGKSINRSMTHSGEVRGGGVPLLKSQARQEIIHWSKVITSDYDVANAKITMHLGENLHFVEEDLESKQRTLWEGTLFRGKHIPINIDLRRTADTSGEIHISLINQDTQKVLLRENYMVP